MLFFVPPQNIAVTNVTKLNRTSLLKRSLTPVTFCHQENIAVTIFKPSIEKRINSFVIYVTIVTRKQTFTVPCYQLQMKWGKSPD